MTELILERVSNSDIEEIALSVLNQHIKDGYTHPIHFYGVTEDTNFVEETLMKVMKDHTDFKCILIRPSCVKVPDKFLISINLYTGEEEYKIIYISDLDNYHRDFAILNGIQVRIEARRKEIVELEIH